MNTPLAEDERQAMAGNVAAQLRLARAHSDRGQRAIADGWLRRAAASGNLDAIAALARHLLSTPAPAEPAVIQQGRQLMMEAAHRGHGEAAHFVSLMAGIDTSMADNWKFALAYLGRSAKSGYRQAQLELAFLAGDRAVADAVRRDRALPLETWHRLHAAVSAPAWLAPAPARTVSVAPHIQIVENFLSPAICDWIVDRARPKLGPAQTYDPLNAKGITGLRRTNSEMRFEFDQLDLVLMFQLHRIAALTDLPLKGIEPPAVLHYRVGQEFKPHHDYLDPAIPAFAREVAASGQRLATVLIYLNADYEGGETDFPLIGYRYKGRKGDALFFRNIQPSGEPDANTLHAGLAPTRGEKWLLSQWIRGHLKQ